MYRPDLVSSNRMAKRLCSENSEILNTSDDNLLSICISQVERYLLASEKQFIEQRTISLSITINDNNYDLQFRTDLFSSFDVATELCTSKASELNLTTENIGKCIDSSASYIQQSIIKWLNQRTIRVSFQNSLRFFI